MAPTASSTFNQMRRIVNKTDQYGNTALHYATQKWPQHTVRRLLELGANIGIKNEWQEIPISKIRPETIKAFLDSESCLTSHSYSSAGGVYASAALESKGAWVCWCKKQVVHGFTEA